MTNFFHCYIVKTLGVRSDVIYEILNGAVYMNKFGRRKIALALACASILGDKTQATNKPQSQKTVAAVGGAASRNKGLSKNQKLAITVTASIVGVAAIVSTIWGVRKHLNKKNVGPNQSEDNNVELINKGIEAINEKLQSSFIGNDEKDLKSIKQLIGHSTKQFALALLNFKEAVINELEKSDPEVYVKKFNEMLEIVKSHQFSKEEESKLADLLRIVKENKIVTEIEKPIKVEKNIIELNSHLGVTYILELKENDFVIKKSICNNEIFKITLTY